MARGHVEILERSARLSRWQYLRQMDTGLLKSLLTGYLIIVRSGRFFYGYCSGCCCSVLFAFGFRFRLRFRLAYSLMFYTLYSVYTHNED